MTPTAYHGTHKGAELSVETKAGGLGTELSLRQCVGFLGEYMIFLLGSTLGRTASPFPEEVVLGAVAKIKMEIEGKMPAEGQALGLEWEQSCLYLFSMLPGPSSDLRIYGLLKLRPQLC